MRTMHDSVNAKDIPRNAAMVGGYVSGQFRWSAADWALFPNAVHVRIATQANINDGNCLDVEPGDATADQSVDWVLMRRRAGLDPSVYCNQLNGWDAIKAAFRRRGVTEPHYWVARYDGSALIPGGAVAKQYANPPLHGQGHFDLSIVADFWPGVDEENTMALQDDVNEIRDWCRVMAYGGYNPLTRIQHPADGGDLTWFDTKLDAKLAPIVARLDQIAVGSIDYAALAKAVNDDAAKRLAQ